MADSDIVKQQAREWVDRLNSGAGLEGAWRLQRIEKRSRVAVEGETARELPVRIRRFAKGIPVNFVDEAIRYLISIAPYEDIVYNGMRLEGAYAPTRTWWERDDQAVVDRGQMRENTYTIYQDLIDRDHADLEEFDAGGNCSEEVSMRYEYDTFTIEDVPPGGQGVTRSIQAISRNEDGTFNYAVVTRTAKTAVGDEQTVKCDEFQTVSQQSYQNLYGTEGHYTDESGVGIDLPKPCEDKETGTLIEVQVRKNDDCTYDATVTKTVAKTDGNPAEVTKQKTLRGVTETVTQRNVTDDSTVVTKIGDKVQVERNPDGTVNRSDTHAVLEPVGDIGSQCEKTIFEHTHSDMENVATRPAKEATEASGGVIHEVSARATEEGTWDVTDKVTTEKPVTSAQHVKRKSLRGITETTVDRNVTDETVEVTNIGDEVRVEKTPGGLVNRTVTHAVNEPVGDIGSDCQQTVFEHEHAEVRNESARPEDEASPASGGVIHQVTSRATEEGTWDVTRKTTTELENLDAQHMKRKSLRGVTETVVQRNTSDSSVAVTNIGDEVRVEKTPGGKWNRTVTTVAKEDVGDIGSQCSKTIFEHEHSDIENVATRPDKEATEAGGGVIHEVSARATEEGTWDVTDKTTTEKPVTSAQHSKRKTLRGVTETIVDRNVTDESVDVTNVGDEIRVEKTPGGLVNRTKVSVDKTADDIDLGDQCQKTVFEHQQRKDIVTANKPSDIHTDDAGGGKTHQMTLRQTEEGSWEVSDVTTEELESTDAQVEKRKTLRGVTETHVHRNVSDNSVDVSKIGDRVSVERTPGGLYNRTVTSVSPESVGDTGTTCQKTIFEREHTDLSNESTKPSIDVPAASGGVIHEKSARATEEGTWDVVDKTTTELEVSSAVHSKRKTLRGVTETTVDRNVNNSDVTVTNIGDEVRVEKTPGGKWNRTVTTMSDEPVGTTGKGCSITPSVHTDTEISNVPDGSQPEPGHQTSDVNIERSVEIRRTEEGTWDVTNRTTVHQPWGEETIATADNSSQTVEIHAFQNLTEVPPMTSGEGQMITASASRNNVGSFDGNFRVVTGKPWGEETIATADNDSQTVEIHAFQNLSSVPAMTAGQGQSITASASRNELGLFDGNFRKVIGKPWGEALIATATSPARDVEIHAFQNLSAVPAMTAATGEDISANAHRNELGLFDGGFTKTTYKTVSATSTSTTAIDTVTTTVVRNSTNSSPTASNGEAHATPDEHGTYSTTVSEHRPKQVSIGPVTWESTVETPHAVLHYSHSLYVFRNLSTPPTPSGAGEVSCSISINNFGLVDGHITTKTLTSWTLKESGGGGGSQSSFSYYRYTFVNGIQYKQKVHGTTYTVGNGPSASMIGDRQVSGGGVTQAYVCEPWEPA